MAELLLNNLSKTFGGRVHAVEGFSLKVADGERVALLGPSGCGKSTLLRLIAGLERPDAGEVHIGGRRVDRLPPHRRSVAMVFQQAALYPHLNVAENLGFGLKLAGERRAERSRLVSEVASLLNLEDLLRRRPASLSGGEAQRVALGRALVRRPDVFLLDEPLSHLDAPRREELLEEIRRLHAHTRTTLLFVTHDQREATALGQRIAVQQAGRLVQVGEPRDLLRRPANLFVAEFLGLPGCNVRRGRLKRENGSLLLVLESGQMPLPARHNCENGEVLLGLRPEHLTTVGREHPGAVEARLLEVREASPESLWRIEALGGSWLLRAPGLSGAREGDRVHVSFQTEHAHLFHADSGERIG